MSKSQKKKVVVTTSSASKSPKAGTTSSSRRAVVEPLLFGKETYIWMAGGALLIIVGLFLMSGGRMPDANTWDPDLIYGFRRTVLAPIVILAGLIVEIYAIFKK
jgi:hypothetical protein